MREKLRESERQLALLRAEFETERETSREAEEESRQCIDMLNEDSAQQQSKIEGLELQQTQLKEKLQALQDENERLTNQLCSELVITF